MSQRKTHRHSSTDPAASPPAEWDFFASNEIKVNGIAAESIKNVYAELVEGFDAQNTPAYTKSKHLVDSLDERMSLISKALAELAAAEDCPIDISKWSAADPITWKIDYSPAVPDGGQSLPKMDLTRFEYELLYQVARSGPMVGTDLRAAMQKRVATVVSNGKLYPALNDLHDAGLISKDERDRRSYDYGLTEKGREVLRRDAQWRYSVANDVGGE